MLTVFSHRSRIQTSDYNNRCRIFTVGARDFFPDLCFCCFAMKGREWGSSMERSRSSRAAQRRWSRKPWPSSAWLDILVMCTENNVRGALQDLTEEQETR